MSGVDVTDLIAAGTGIRATCVSPRHTPTPPASIATNTSPSVVHATLSTAAAGPGRVSVRRWVATSQISVVPRGVPIASRALSGLNATVNACSPEA